MRRHVQIAKKFIFVTIIATLIVAFDRNDGLPMDLSQFQWKNRLLFLFAPDANHPDFKKLQHDITGQPDEVKDRNLVIFELFEQDTSRINLVPTDQQTAASIRNQFSVPSQEFTIILVGKDGGVKLKREGYVSLATVYDLIDSMPMRQNEMRQRKQ